MRLQAAAKAAELTEASASVAQLERELARIRLRLVTLAIVTEQCSRLTACWTMLKLVGVVYV